MMKREQWKDKVFLSAAHILLIAVALVVLYPLLYILSASVSDPRAIYSGRMWLFPIDVTLEGYKRVFQSQDLLLGYRNTIAYTILGVAINMGVTMTCAFALSRKSMIGRKLLTSVFMVTMFFHGGLMPSFMLIKSLGLYDSVWAMVLPNAANMMNILIARSYIHANISEDYIEAARIDGCREIRAFLRVVLPLCKPIVAVLMLFYGSMHWNAYFNALIYLRDRRLYTLQVFLREILIQSQISMEMLSTGGDIDAMMEQARAADLVRYTSIVVSSLPMLILYPFLQKHFAKGMMLGGIKG